MRKFPHFAIALGLAFLVATVSIKLFTQPNGAAASLSAPAISIEEVQRSIDVNALPVQQINDPI